MDSVTVFSQASNYVFIGEAGSGKTELAINVAANLAISTPSTVELYDLDQTKALFRARDMATELETFGVSLAETISYMDSPLSPPGVENALEDAGKICILDVGGNVAGAQTIGKYKDYFARGGSRFIYVINPYRPFSEGSAELVNSMKSIMEAARIPEIDLCIAANPCIGVETSGKIVLDGLDLLCESLKKTPFDVDFLVVRESLYESVREKTNMPIFPINLYMSKLYQL